MAIKSLMCCFRRIAKATGGQVVLTLADMDGQETFEASALGTAAEVLLLATSWFCCLSSVAQLDRRMQDDL